VIPTPLLQSISRNLFLRNERKRDEELHPADWRCSRGYAEHGTNIGAIREIDVARTARATFCTIRLTITRKTVFDPAIHFKTDQFILKFATP
jgi:hypothetical protein